MYVCTSLPESEGRCQNYYWHSHTLQELQQVWKVGRRGGREEEGREEERREWKDEGRGERRAREIKNSDEIAGLGRTG